MAAAASDDRIALVVDTSLNLQRSLGPASRMIASYAIVLAIFGAGTYLRVAIADRESVWRDEAQTVAIAGQNFPSAILESLKHDGNSPLFYLLEHFLLADRSSPHRELRDRALSVALGLLYIPLVFIAGREIGRRSYAAGVTAAVIGALSPVLVDLSTQVRPYSAVAVATAAMALGALLIEKNGSGWFLYGGAAALGFYLHALFATTIAAFGAVLLFQAIRTGSIRQWLVAHGAIFAAILPGLLFLHQQVITLTIANGRIPWGTTPTLRRLWRQVMVMLTASEGGDYRLLVLGIAVAFFWMAARNNGQARRIGSVAGLSLLVSFMLALRSGGFETRYHVAPLTLALITLSAGAPAILSKRRLAGGAVVAASIFTLGLIDYSAALPSARIPRSSAREVAALLQTAGTTDVIVIVPDTIAIAVNYYLPPRSGQIDPPELGRTKVIDFRGWSSRLSDPARIAAIETIVRRAASSKQRLWLVIWQPMLGPAPTLSPKDAEHSALPAQWALGRAVVRSIAAHYEPVTVKRVGPSFEEMAVIAFEPREIAP